MVEVPSESVLYDEHAQAYPIMAPTPLPDYDSSQGWQIVLQTTIYFPLWRRIHQLFSAGLP
jgi:hypothetical protein